MAAVTSSSPFSSLSALQVPIVDTHVHVFPSLLKEDLLSAQKPDEESGYFQSIPHNLKKTARRWWAPLSKGIHHSQTILRHIPEKARMKLDELTSVAPLLGFFLESTATDLIDSMNRNGVSQSWLIAHPPYSSNEFILEITRRQKHLEPSGQARFIPVVNMQRTTRKVAQQLKAYVNQGARAVKIHPAADGLGPESSHYRKIIKTATDLGIPIIIHTGCIHTHMLYKNPEMGRAQHFQPWFKEFKSARFILAHMNFHEPQLAFDLAEEHSNLYMDTSWQPSEIIGEAVRRLGSERILFGTDWPIIGNNLKVGLSRIADCLDSGMISSDDAKRILSLNATELTHAS